MQKKMRNKSPAVPSERGETVRRKLLECLLEGESTARELSAVVGVSEQEVCGHLEHLRLTLQSEGRRLEVIPARCLECGFVFVKRQRLKKPGRCPVCRGEHIADPLYDVTR